MPGQAGSSGIEPDTPPAGREASSGPIRLELDANARRILDLLPSGVVTFDSELGVIAANRQATQLIDLRERLDSSLGSGTDPAKWPDWPAMLRSAMSSGETRTFDDVNYRLAGNTRVLRVVCIPQSGGIGVPTDGGVLLVENVTDESLMRRRLADAERLAAIGRLVSKVAHELNNPMDGILRYINLAIRLVEDQNTDKPVEYLKQCRQGLMRMVRIVSELLEFSRSSRASVEYIRIEQIIEEAVRTMQAGAEQAHVTINQSYDTKVPEIYSGNLFHVFCNLVKNAIDAMPEGGELQISTRLEDTQTVVVAFADTGTGFPPHDAEAIFEPFFTTKELTKGTGLGLAICRDIVEARGGRISAENRPAGGSIFAVRLPLGRQAR